MTFASCRARAGANASSGRQGDGRPPYIKEFSLKEKFSDEDLGVELNYIYLCLDRFGKSAEESKDPVDRFMYSLKNLENFQTVPGTQAIAATAEVMPSSADGNDSPNNDPAKPSKNKAKFGS